MARGASERAWALSQTPRGPVRTCSAAPGTDLAHLVPLWEPGNKRQNVWRISSQGACGSPCVSGAWVPGAQRPASAPISTAGAGWALGRATPPRPEATPNPRPAVLWSCGPGSQPEEAVLRQGAHSVEETTLYRLFPEHCASGRLLGVRLGLTRQQRTQLWDGGWAERKRGTGQATACWAGLGLTAGSPEQASPHRSQNTASSGAPAARSQPERACCGEEV